MGNARNVAGSRARSGRPRLAPEHYLTTREAAEIAREQRAKDEKRGIFRMWNGRKPTAKQLRRARRVGKKIADALQNDRARRLALGPLMSNARLTPEDRQAKMARLRCKKKPAAKPATSTS